MIAPRQIAVVLHSNSCKTLNNLAHLGQWNPLYLESLCPLSNTLTLLKVSQLGAIRILNNVDPMALMSKYRLYHEV